MKDNIQILISLGFLTALGLIFSLVASSLAQLQSGTDDMARLVEVANSKTAAAGDMRDAILQRAGSLKAMRLTPDAIERDAEQQRFLAYADEYRIARENLVSLGMDPQEVEIHEQLASLTREALPHGERAAGLLIEQTYEEEISAAPGTAEHHQNRILELLDRLVALEKNNAIKALEDSREHNRGTLRLLITLSAIACCICLLIVHMVMRGLAKKNRLLNYQATHDPLTGLINRREFEARVERAIKHAHVQSATHALLYMDLDQFKTVNDACGHLAGDDLLQQVSQLLLSSVRKRDTLSRLGGDEFGMLLENCPLEKAVEIASDLLHALDGFRFSRGDNTYVLGISIGVVPLDRSTTCLASAMSAADSACSVARQPGHNRVQIAQPGELRLQERHGRMQWVSRLRQALAENRFGLFFQPIVPCASPAGQVKHIEILLRLIDDDGSVVTPGIFLPAAEKYDLVTGIDRWVVENALQWLAARAARNHWPVMTSINLSGQSISDPSMQKFIIDRVVKHGIPPEQICFEITETAAIANITAATSFMLSLRSHGFRFSLDDFGSGLSSFTYLKKLPVDYLKIDGTFVRDILSDPVDHAIVKSISELSRLLGKKTIAEFVETMAVADELRSMGVNYVQGYAYAQPQSLDDFEQIMGPRLVVVSSR